MASGDETLTGPPPRPRAGAAGPAPCLVVLAGAGAERGRHFELGAIATIGREAAAHVRLDDDTVSRRHAEIRASGDRRVLRDLGGRNGSFVNDQPLRGGERELCDGDRITIGATVLKFTLADPLERAYHESLRRGAHVDALTGALSRRHIEQVLAREVGRARRHERPLSLALFDIDHFKRVNDTWGHAAGDAVLSALCERVRAALRASDRLGRWGGEEFALVLPETARAGARRLAEKVRRLVAAEPLSFDGQAIPVTVSLGVACLGSAHPDPAALLRAADENLYRAKESGRNRVVG